MEFSIMTGRLVAVEYKPEFPLTAGNYGMWIWHLGMLSYRNRAYMRKMICWPSVHKRAMRNARMGSLITAIGEKALTGRRKIFQAHHITVVRVLPGRAIRDFSDDRFRGLFEITPNIQS